MDSNTEGGLEYKAYLAERSLLTKAGFEQSRLFDKAILTLTTGAFAFSLTFIRKVVPDIQPSTEYILMVAWFGFGVSLITTLISFLTSQDACLKQIEMSKPEDFCSHGFHDRKPEDAKDATNTSTVWTRRLNIFSILSFAVGTFFLAAYIFVNLT